MARLATERIVQKILREKARRELTGLPRRSWDRMEAAGRAPRRLRLSGHTVGWLAGELDAWIQERVAERDGTVEPKAA